MAKNSEVYKTAQERAEAFHEYCKITYGNCKFRPAGCADCALEWLDLEVEEEKPLPCPFCGGDCRMHSRMLMVVCDKTDCTYQSGIYETKEEAIAAHNRVAKKCREAQE